MTPLQQAAQALIDRWLSPSYIAQDVEQLRKALEADLAQSAEPAAWGMERDGVILDIINPEEHERYEGDYTIPLYTATTNWTRPINYTPPHMGRKPLTDDEIWKNDTIMSANSGYGQRLKPCAK